MIKSNTQHDGCYVSLYRHSALKLGVLRLLARKVIDMVYSSSNSKEAFQLSNVTFRSQELLIYPMDADGRRITYIIN